MGGCVRRWAAGWASEYLGRRYRIDCRLCFDCLSIVQSIRDAARSPGMRCRCRNNVFALTLQGIAMRSIVSDLIDPVLLLTLLGLFLLLALWRRRAQTGSGSVLFMTLIYLLTAFACTPYGAHLLLRELERPFPPLASRPDDLDAVVVLGGALNAGPDPKTLGELGADSLRRCVYAAQLYHDGTRIPIVVSGGNLDPDRFEFSIAEAMREFLIDLGVPEENIVLEDRSKNTMENATFTARILQERKLRRVALVTDGSHLKRAERCFRLQPGDVDLVPCGTHYRAIRSPLDRRHRWQAFIPCTWAADHCRAAIHEFAGMAWYAWQ